MKLAALLLVSAYVLTAQQVQRAEHQGIAVELEVKSLDAAAGTALATIRLTDAATGTPLKGLKPRVWLAKRRNEAVASESTCDDKIRAFTSGPLPSRPDADLNGYLIATLNHDSTVTFINPQFPSNNKMQAAVELKARGFDWVYAPTIEKIFISMPGASAIAQIDTISLKHVGDIALEPGSKPGRIALAPDGESIWVSLDGATKVAVIDGHAGKLRQYVDTGDGLHAFAFAAADSRAFITNSVSNTVTVAETNELRAIATVPVDTTPVAVTWASVARAAYVASLNGEHITAIDFDSNAVRARIPVGRGVVAIAADPTGRYIVAANQIASRVLVIDSATHTITASVATPEEPDQIAFTDRYVYLRSLNSDQFTLLKLSELRAGKAAPIQVQAGAKPSNDPAIVSAAPVIAATPDGDSVIVANGPEANLYLYAEGAMAPGGIFSNYNRKPLGLLLLDRSLRPLPNGAYAAPLRISSGGRYDVPVLLDQPRVKQCFTVTLPNPVTVTSRPHRQLHVVAASRMASGRAVVSFEITDAAKGAPATGLDVLQLLAFEPPGRWQQRQQLSEVKTGVYEASQDLPHAGSFVFQLLTLDPALSLDARPIRLTVPKGSK